MRFEMCGALWVPPSAPTSTYLEVSVAALGRAYLLEGKYPPGRGVSWYGGAMPRNHPVPDVYSSACPSRRVMAVLAEKWTLLVVAALADGPMRTAELRRCVDGVSEKMLIQTLRKLESYALVSRKSYPEIPPRVEYRLTPLGRPLARRDHRDQAGSGTHEAFRQRLSGPVCRQTRWGSAPNWGAVDLPANRQCSHLVKTPGGGSSTLVRADAKTAPDSQFHRK